MCKRDCKKRTRNFLPRFFAADAEMGRRHAGCFHGCAFTMNQAYIFMKYAPSFTLMSSDEFVCPISPVYLIIHHHAQHQESTSTFHLPLSASRHLGRPIMDHLLLCSNKLPLAIVNTAPQLTVRRSQSSPVPQAPKPCTGTELSVLNIFSLSVLFSPQSLQSMK